MTIIRFRRNTETQWDTKNPILAAGEPGYEIDTRKFKVGDGISPWVDLDDFMPSQSMLAAIQEAVDNAFSDEYDRKPIIQLPTIQPASLVRDEIQPFDPPEAMTNLPLPSLSEVSINDTYWIRNLSSFPITQPLFSGDHTTDGDSSFTAYAYQTLEMVCVNDPRGFGKVWMLLNVASSADPGITDDHFERAYVQADTTWIWEHNLGYTPIPIVMTSDRAVVNATIIENSPERTVVSFYFPFAGILALS